jgi:phospholipid-transporting ATPase
LYRKTAVIVAGDSLLKITKSDKLKKEFMELCTASQVVLACRVSPKQKAEIVHMYKEEFPEHTTLAIGDGANDVNMISAAHIGVGISGLEGQQAARASDYAIGQFKHLKNLLFVHGREAYRRNSYLVGYMFYKNVLFVFPIFWYGFMSAFSGTQIYDPFLYQGFNIAFTAFPVMWFALFDFNYTKETLLSNPKYYKIGLKGECFNKWVFWRWIFYGTW